MFNLDVLDNDDETVPQRRRIVFVCEQAPVIIGGVIARPEYLPDASVFDSTEIAGAVEAACNWLPRSTIGDTFVWEPDQP